MVSQTAAQLRPSGVITRQTTDLLPSLDIHWLRKVGALHPGAVIQPQWTTHGVTTATIRTVMSANGRYLTLMYHKQGLEETWTKVEEAIPLESTLCAFGGERLWFQCRGCGMWEPAGGVVCRAGRLSVPAHQPGSFRGWADQARADG